MRRCILRVKHPNNFEFKAVIGTDGELSYAAAVDYAGREAQNAMFGDRIMASRVSNINQHFYWGVNPLAISSVVSGNGVIDTTASMLRVGTTGATGTAVATSRDRIYYKTGHDAFALFTAGWQAPASSLGSDAVLCSGAYDDQSGYAVALTKDGFHALHRKGGTDTLVPQSEFNLDHLDGTGASKFTLNTGTINIFRITYGYLGIAPAVIEIYGGFDKGWIPFHVFNVINTQLSLIINFPFLPIRFEATGTFNGAAYIFSGSWAGGIVALERGHVAVQHFAAEGDQSSINTTLRNVISIRPRATFNGGTNHIPITVEQLSAAALVTIGQAIVKVGIYRDATLGGTPAWTPANANSSIEYDTAGTTVTGGDFLGSFLVTQGGSRTLQLEHGQLGARPGEMLTFAAVTTANSADVSTSIMWQELY